MSTNSKFISIAGILAVVASVAGCSGEPVKSETELKAGIPAGFIDGGEGIAWKIGEAYYSFSGGEYSKTCGINEVGRMCLDISYYTYRACERITPVGTENDIFTDQVLHNGLPGSAVKAEPGAQGLFQVTQRHSPGSRYNDGYWVVKGLTCN